MSPEVVRRLRDEVDELREENRQLKILLQPIAALPKRWGLTPQQAVIVATLARAGGKVLSRETLLAAMYGAGHEHEESCLRVAILHFRRRHDRHGLTIETVLKHGLRMPPANCAAVMAALAESVNLRPALATDIDTPSSQPGL